MLVSDGLQNECGKIAINQETALPWARLTERVTSFTPYTLKHEGSYKKDKLLQRQFSRRKVRIPKKTKSKDLSLATSPLDC